MPGTSGAQPNSHLPSLLRPTEQNISNDPAHKYGESQILVSPRNPNNLLSCWVKDSYTQACVDSGDPNCQSVNRTLRDGPVALPIGPGPAGYFFGGPRFVENGIFVSFNRGTSWTRVEIPLFPPDHPEFINQGDASCTVGPDGTFYTSWDAFDWNVPDDALAAGGIGVSKSTNGGLTWSTPVLTGTALDSPKVFADVTTGRVYEASSGAINGRLATGNPDDPLFPPGVPGDRYIVASSNGVSWGAPHGIGGSDGTTYFVAQIGAANPFLAPAHGVLAASFRSTNAAACTFFVGTGAPCIVFQTSTDDGATWTRRAVPADVITGNVSVAADPTKPGHYTVAGTNALQVAVYQTYDSGVTWTGPTLVADAAPFPKYFLWTAYSLDGAFGMVWRAAQQATGIPFSTPYIVWATLSDDGGATFYKPLQISAAASPANPPGQGPGDDYTGITFATSLHHRWLTQLIGQVENPQVVRLLRHLFGADRMYLTWADRRPGERAAFVGTAKLHGFRHHANQ